MCFVVQYLLKCVFKSFNDFKMSSRKSFKKRSVPNKLLSCAVVPCFLSDDLSKSVCPCLLPWPLTPWRLWKIPRRSPSCSCSLAGIGRSLHLEPTTGTGRTTLHHDDDVWLHLMSVPVRSCPVARVPDEEGSLAEVSVIRVPVEDIETPNADESLAKFLLRTSLSSDHSKCRVSWLLCVCTSLRW